MTNTKTWGIIAGVGVVLVGGALGGGYAMGRSEVDAVEQEMHAAEAEADAHAAQLTSEIEDRDARMVAIEQRLNRFEARRLLSITLSDLDARNFGLAEDHLAEVADKITAGAGDDLALTALGAEVGATRITVGDDLEPQRQALLVFVTRLDQALD